MSNQEQKHSFNNQPLIISGNHDTLEFEYNTHKQLNLAKTKDSTVELHYDILGKVETQTQDNIEVHYSQDVNTHTNTLSFTKTYIPNKTQQKEPQA